MHIFYSGSVAVHLRDEGPRDGPVIMLANSLGTDMRVWDLMLPFMPEGARIVRFDKRGHGLSDCPDGPYAIDDLAGDAIAIADALALRDITFVGLSIGGLIGQAVALRRPDLIRRLVLMDTAAKIGDEAMWQDRIAAVQSGGLEPMADMVMQRWFAPSFYADRVRLAPWRNMLARTPAAGYVGCCHAIAGADFTARAAGMTCPVMAMAGDVDLSTPPAVVQATAELYGARFHVIENAGHIPCVEHPEQVANLIADFMETT